MPLVSDTTALRYLIEIEAVHLLPVLFGQVTIPPEVAAELQRPKHLFWYAPGWLRPRLGSASGSQSCHLIRGYVGYMQGSAMPCC